jgi:hypothetical protein
MREKRKDTTSRYNVLRHWGIVEGRARLGNEVIAGLSQTDTYLPAIREDVNESREPAATYMMVYGGRKNCSSTIHMPSDGQLATLGAIPCHMFTSNKLSKEEKAHSLVKGRSTVLVRIDHLVRAVCRPGPSSIHSR